jgi:hypothetical protein
MSKLVMHEWIHFDLHIYMHAGMQLGEIGEKRSNRFIHAFTILASSS